MYCVYTIFRNITKSVRLILLLLVLLCLFLNKPVESGWYFNAQLRLTNCPSVGVSYIPTLPSLGPFPTKQSCESTRSMVLSLRVWLCGVPVGVNTAALTGELVLSIIQ